MTKNLWEDNDSFVADCGFKTDEELELLNVKLNFPLFLSGQSQLLKNEATESHSIASVRILVKRTLTQIKKLQVLNCISLSLHGHGL